MSCPDSFFSSTLHKAAAATAIPLAFLRSNTYPVLPGALRDPLNSFQNDLKHYDDDIKAVRTILARLTQEREALALVTAPWAAVFAPIRKLPNELLLLILHNAVGDNDTEGIYDDGTCSRSMAVLSHTAWRGLGAVCRHWLDVIKSTPSIWANVNVIGLDYMSDFHAEKVLRRAMARTKGMPLRISLAMPQRLEDTTAVLVQQAERWKVLTLWAGYDELKELIQHIPGRLLVLESLDVRLLSRKYGSDSNPWEDEKWTLFEEAPALRHLTFPDFPPCVPWSQLVNVHMVCTRFVYNNLAFLKNCAPHCCVKISGVRESSVVPKVFPWQTAPPPPMPPVQADIAGLHLSMMGDRRPGIPGVLGPMLGFLDLPRLKSLTLERSNTGNSSNVLWDTNAFAAFARRSPHVTALHLRNMSIDVPQLCEALRLMPLIEMLDIALPLHYESLIVKEVLRSIGEAEKGLVPWLTRFAWEATQHFPVPLLAELASARARKNTEDGRRDAKTGHAFVLRVDFDYLSSWDTPKRDEVKNLSRLVAPSVANHGLQLTTTGLY
ncbi:F-box domain-containing protein [Mycena indigotica]|uniref:F-box domain-containing protein n=1 Tax=Mycena indigotica TaxID=2126181 RepID=A0A8H6SD59_9AGAR|nr:F-box domain-containing protein [Mycena indigotica]KAF7296767.1 F-box domain-containing protein [Mycena indigotica]